MNFENQVKMALAQEGKALLRSQVDKAYAAYRPAVATNQHLFRWAAAAFLAFALAALWFVQTPATGNRTAQLFSENFDPYGTPTFRGAVLVNPTWAKALSEYDQKNYKLAASLFEETLKDLTFKEKDAAYLCLGVSLLADQQPAAAAGAFQKVGNASLLYPDAQWYEALAALANNNTSHAKVLLTAIAQDSSHHQQKKAQKMLTRL